METKKKRSNIWVFLLLAIIVGIMILASQGNRSRESGASLSSEPTRFAVEYSVTGTAARGSITIENETGSTEQHDIRIPWDKSFMVDAGEFVYLSVQNDGDTGSVSCEIKINGSIYKTATSTDEYGIASCSGSAGE